MFDALSSSMTAKVLAIMAVLSGVRLVLDAFGNKDNKFTIALGKVVDFFSANIKH